MNSQYPMANQGFGLHRPQGDPLNCILEATPECGALYIGDIESVSNPFILQNHQIGAILTVSREYTSLSFPPYINHLALPIDDNHMFDISQYFAQGIDFIAQNRFSTNVLVHCRMGASRSATVVLAYLMKEYGMSLNESFSFVKEKRWKVLPNSGFMNQLRQFERFLHQRNRRTMSIGNLNYQEPHPLTMSIANLPPLMGSQSPFYNWY